MTNTRHKQNLMCLVAISVTQPLSNIQPRFLYKLFVPINSVVPLCIVGSGYESEVRVVFKTNCTLDLFSPGTVQLQGFWIKKIIQRKLMLIFLINFFETTVTKSCFVFLVRPKRRQKDPIQKIKNKILLYRRQPARFLQFL